ncbi:MAG: hypothetical protein LBT17_01050 [Mycoplasmataceae bacterium]|jgi:hypothetical protein|nr:hypothetical protein [Mycoplasmataceae bacterium]
MGIQTNIIKVQELSKMFEEQDYYKAIENAYKRHDNKLVNALDPERVGQGYESMIPARIVMRDGTTHLGCLPAADDWTTDMGLGFMGESKEIQEVVDKLLFEEPEQFQDMYQSVEDRFSNKKSKNIGMK